MRFLLYTTLLVNLVFFLGCKTSTEEQPSVSSSSSQSVEEPKETEEEEGKPQTIIVPTGSLGDISEVRKKMLEKTLESKLDDHFDIVPKELFEEAQEKAFEELDYEECTEERCISMIQEILQVPNAFQLVLMTEGSDTQISLTWNDLDKKRVEEDYCEGCQTKELRESIAGLVEKLVGVKKEIIIQRTPDGIEKTIEKEIKLIDNQKKEIINYKKIIQNSETVNGCESRIFGCEKALSFPIYKDSFKISSYRRMRMYGNKFWQNSGININEDEKVLIIGSGRITTCPKKTCNNGGPSTPGREKIWIKINDTYDRIYFKIHGDIYSSSFYPKISGKFKIVAEDWSGGKPEFINYSDNSGFYIFDIFTYNANEETSFKIFLNELMKVNEDDIHSKILNFNFL
jgi:hypothetical protein